LRADLRGPFDGFGFHHPGARGRFAAVDEALVEHGELGRAGHTTASRYTDGAHFRFVEGEDRVRGNLAPTAGRWCRRDEVAYVCHAAVLFGGQPDKEVGETHGVEDAFAHVGAEV